MGLSALIPITHAILLFGLKQAHKQCGMYWYLLEGLFYAIGATFYVVSAHSSLQYQLAIVMITCLPRNEYQSAGGLERLISGAARISCFMGLFFLEWPRTSRA